MPRGPGFDSRRLHSDHSKNQGGPALGGRISPLETVETGRDLVRRGEMPLQHRAAAHRAGPHIDGRPRIYARGYDCYFGIAHWQLLPQPDVPSHCSPKLDCTWPSPQYGAQLHEVVQVPAP